jgi:RimJ/RimL family protein N-acetyltransferase
MNASHKDDFRRPAAEEALWKWMPFRAAVSGFDQYFDDIVKNKSENTIIPFVVTDKRTARVVGVTAYLSVAKLHRSLEIGYTWFGSEARGTKIYAATSHILFSRAFEWGARRIEMKASASNEIALAAIRKLGAVEEGRLRSNIRTVDGSWQDTVLFSILKEEWPDVCKSLMERLS